MNLEQARDVVLYSLDMFDIGAYEYYFLARLVLNGRLEVLSELEPHIAAWRNVQF